MTMAQSSLTSPSACWEDKITFYANSLILIQIYSCVCLELIRTDLWPRWWTEMEEFVFVYTRVLLQIEQPWPPGCAAFQNRCKAVWRQKQNNLTTVHISLNFERKEKTGRERWLAQTCHFLLWNKKKVPLSTI